jgi:hypothetical protein
MALCGFLGLCVESGLGADDMQAPAARANAKRVALGQNVWLEVQGRDRRVVIDAYVCLREGALEQLMCLKQTKEHEAILAADADARDMHKGLLLAGAKPGAPVRYDPKFQPPTGSAVRVTLRYQLDGKPVRVPARHWVRDMQTRRELDKDWVFAGSVFHVNPLDEKGPPVYAANGGDVICVSNFEGAMLDLPIKSSNNNDDLSFEAFSEHIPPLKTPVQVILEVAPSDKK